jgi:hypothetical protein
MKRTWLKIAVAIAVPLLAGRVRARLVVNPRQPVTVGMLGITNDVSGAPRGLVEVRNQSRSEFDFFFETEVARHGAWKRAATQHEEADTAFRLRAKSSQKLSFPPATEGTVWRVVFSCQRAGTPFASWLDWLTVKLRVHRYLGFAAPFHRVAGLEIKVPAQSSFSPNHTPPICLETNRPTTTADSQP